MRRNPGFVLAAVLTLSIGIGASTAIVSFLNAVLLRPLPVAEPARLVAFARTGGSEALDRYFSYPDFTALADGGKQIDGISAFGLQVVTIGAGEAAESTIGTLVSEKYFDALGVRPAVGRFFTSDEVRPGAPPVVVLGWDKWRRQFNGDPAIIGKTAHVNGQMVTVVGVAPERFNGTISLVAVDVWAPLSLYPVLYPGREMSTPSRWLQVVGRLAPRQTLTSAQAFLKSSRIDLPNARSPHERVVVEPLRGLPGAMDGGGLRTSTLLFVIGLLVLGIASVNVAGMLVARGAARRSEIAMRLALGATRGDLVRQLLVESTCLWLLSAVGGVALAGFLGRRLPSLVPVQEAFPARLGLDLSIDGTVLLISLMLALVTGLTFGLGPALRASRPDLIPALKQQVGGDQQGSSFRSSLVVAQVAASVLLLVIAGVFVRTVQYASSADPGFNPDGVAVASLNLDLPAYPEARGRQFYGDLLQRLGQRRDVEAAAVASVVPLGAAQSTIGIDVPGATEFRQLGTPVPYTAVTADYFRTLQIRLLGGRTFSPSGGGAGEVVVSQSTARRFWPGTDAVGRSIKIAGRTMQVVGVVADVQSEKLGAVPPTFLYLPFEQRYVARAHVFVRGSGDAVRSIGQEVRSLAPNLPLISAKPLRNVIVALMPQRVIAVVTAGLGFFALLLTAVGTYGIIAFNVAQRTPEIATRIAMGATHAQVIAFVLRHGLGLFSVGLAVGVVLATLFSRALSGMIVGRGSLDPVVFGVVALLLTGVTLLASLVPAWRAVRINPMSVLRAG
jgi:predicted permease